MHTPGHGVVNLAVLGTAAPPDVAAAILLGAVLPDVPIMILYAKERWLRGTPEERIWAEHYQRRSWQGWIHGMHSFPLALAGLAGGWALGLASVAAFFGSMLLHALADLPVHAEDAHRHFFPFSDYRFQSPLSYWDVRHFGAYVAIAEIAIVIAGSWVLWAAHPSHWARALLLFVNAWYLFNYWRSYVHRAPHRDTAS